MARGERPLDWSAAVSEVPPRYHAGWIPIGKVGGNQTHQSQSRSRERATVFWRNPTPSRSARAPVGAPPTLVTPLWPAPIPRMVRPWEATSTEAAADAVMDGCRETRFVTHAASRMRETLHALTDVDTLRTILWGSYKNFYVGAGGEGLVGAGLAATVVLVLLLAWRATGRDRWVLAIGGSAAWMFAVVHLVSSYEIPILKASPMLA